MDRINGDRKMNVEALKVKLLAMSPKEVKDYALKHYPNLYFSDLVQSVIISKKYYFTKKIIIS